MDKPDFMQHVRLPDLGFGAAMMMWGFRACALGHAQCGCLVGGFERIFGPVQGELVLRQMLTMARVFGNEGRRRVTIAMPGSLGVTPDEGALLSALNAAQAGEEERCLESLQWLLAKEPAQELVELTTRLADAYVDRGLIVLAPENVPVPARNPAGAAVVDLASVRAMGSA